MMRSFFWRWMFRIALCLVLSAITTVAVAWVFAYTVDAASNKTEGANMHSEGGMVIDYHYVVVSRAFGFTAVESTRARPDGVRASIYDDVEPVRVPSWADDVHTPTEAYANQSTDREYRFLIATGWPMRAFSSELDKGTAVPAFLIVGTLEYKGGAIDSIVVPYRPIFPGFYLDTLIFAVPWFVILFVPGAIRRSIRRKRGRCPRCGYNLRGQFDDGCAECGWNRANNAPDRHQPTADVFPP